jgi:GTP pyrophosphokinase
MVSVVQLRRRTHDALIERALAFARPLYEGQLLSTGEPVWPHALGLRASLASIGVDPAAQAAGVLFAVPKMLRDPERLKAEFGEEIAGLAAGVEKLYKLRVLTRASAGEQNEILRKMVLGMVEDIRVVLIRLRRARRRCAGSRRTTSRSAKPMRASRSTSIRRSPTASASGSSSGSWRTCRSATSSPSSTRRSRRCSTRSASSASNTSTARFRF